MRKIVLIALALVLALGSLGVGYAMWSDTVTVSGPVETGTVSWTFNQDFSTNDPLPGGPPYDSGSLDWTITPGDFSTIHRGNKNVGSANVSMIDPHNIEVKLFNTYPCYAVTVTVHAENTGSIPINIGTPLLTYPDPNNPGQFITVPLPDSTVVYVPGNDQYGGVSNVLEFWWVDNIGDQVEPGGEKETSFKIHVLQPAMQDSEYTFSISVTVEQWNE
jgi:predicted ribosomally synthesized peptide with SipW-like signal peptide